MKKALSIILAVVIFLSFATVEICASTVKETACIKQVGAFDCVLPCAVSDGDIQKTVFPNYYILHIALKRSIVFLNIAN